MINDPAGLSPKESKLLALIVAMIEAAKKQDVLNHKEGKKSNDKIPEINRIQLN